MSAMDFDSLWDYSKPDQTEEKLSDLLAELPQGDPIVPELLTQIARAQGLQHKFAEAHRTLDLVERKLGNDPSRAKVRYLWSAGASLILRALQRASIA
jgi:hypothetical protein